QERAGLTSAPSKPRRTPNHAREPQGSKQPTLSSPKGGTQPSLPPAKPSLVSPAQFFPPPPVPVSSVPVSAVIFRRFRLPPSHFRLPPINSFPPLYHEGGALRRACKRRGMKSWSARAFAGGPKRSRSWCAAGRPASSRSVTPV